MDLKDSLDILLKLGDRINEYWMLLHALNLVAIGWLVVARKELPLERNGKICVFLLLALYWGLTLSQIHSIAKTYDLLVPVNAEIRKLAKGNGAVLSDATFREILQELKWSSGKVPLTCGMIATGFIITVLVLFAIYRGVGYRKKMDLMIIDDNAVQAAQQTRGEDISRR